MANAPDLTAADYEYRLPDHWILPQESIWTQMHDAYVRRVVELVRSSGAQRVLELGCGDGWNCAQLAEAGLEAVGVDWSRNGVEHAKRMVPRARFVCGDVRKPQVQSALGGLFDAVVFVEVLEHIPPRDCPAVLRTIARQLRPGGVLVLTTPSVNFPNDNPQHYRHFDEATLRGLISADVGFVIEHIEGYGDVTAADRYYRFARWVDNRYWVIKPVRRLLQSRYQRHTSHTPLDRCHGFIVVARKIAATRAVAPGSSRAGERQFGPALGQDDGGNGSISAQVEVELQAERRGDEVGGCDALERDRRLSDRLGDQLRVDDGELD